MADCSKCNSINVEQTDDGNLTCLDCGAILEETDHLQAEITLVTTGAGTRACGGLVSDLSNGTSMATSVGRGVGKGPRPAAFLNSSLQSPTIRHIDAVCGKLELPPIVCERAKFIVKHLNREEKYCRSPVILAAAVIYIALREKDKPYTMYEFGPYLPHNDVFGMGRVYNKILNTNQFIEPLKDVDPAVYVDRAIGKLKVTEAVQNSLKSLTHRILYFTNGWISTGRRHEAISISAISFAMEALDVNRECLNVLCDTLKVSVHTVKARLREVKTVLLEKAKPLIPWVSSYNDRTVHKVLEKLMSQLEKLTRLINLKRSNEIDKSNSPPSTPSTPCISNSNNDITCNTNDNNNNHNESENNPHNDLRLSRDNFAPEPNKTPNIATLPPSFIVNMVARDRRASKLANAKRRLIATLEKQPELLQTLSPNLQASLASFPRDPPPVLALPAPPSPPVDAYPLAPRYRPPTFPNTPSPSTPSPPISPLSPFSSPSSPCTPPISPNTQQQQQYFHPPPANPAPKPTRRPSRPKPAPVPVILPSFDHEDLIIEKLLLKGVNEDLILSGYYDAQTAETAVPIVHPNMGSEKVGEDDIPDSEMDKFIRSAEEVKLFSEMSSRWEDEGNMDHKPISKRRKRSFKAEDKNEVPTLEDGDSGISMMEDEFQDHHKKPRMANVN